MVKHIITLTLAAILLSSSGCAWLLDTYLDKNSEFKDGRDQDADGLTEKDSRARFIDGFLRQRDREEQTLERKRFAQPDSNSFDSKWEAYLKR